MGERLHRMLVKEFLQVLRDPRMRLMVFLMPLIQVLVFGYAVSTDVRDVPTAVVDFDRTPASRELLATQLAMVLTFLPSFLLSGFMYAIGNMPAPIRAASHVIPARYFVAILKGIYLKGVGLPVLAGEAALLSAFGAGVVFLATRKLRKTLD